MVVLGFQVIQAIVTNYILFSQSTISKVYKELQAKQLNVQREVSGEFTAFLIVSAHVQPFITPVFEELSSNGQMQWRTGFMPSYGAAQSPGLNLISFGTRLN